MKSFYEMIQILNKNKVNEGRKYLAHYSSSDEVKLGERFDYYSWEGTIKIGYDEDDDGLRFPVAWGVEGKLIKYKEDKESKAIYDKDDNLVIDKEFENPGIHGENIPEPYLSGSTEVTGFKELIQLLLKDELEEVNEKSGGGVVTDPNKYDWQEFDGEIREEPDWLLAHHSKIKHGDKEITLGKMDDYSPRRLPWYDDPSKIDPKEIEEAKKVAREITNKNKGPEQEYNWRLRIYTDARTGRGQTGVFPWWMHTHEQALEQMKKYCYHEWEKGDDFSHYNQYLYTGKSGHYETCKRCGEKREVIKWQNNYSGD